MIFHKDLKTILPHRFPMLLVDVVQSFQKSTSIIATKNISKSEMCFWGYSHEEVQNLNYPPVLIIESFCQAAGILLNLSLPDKVNLKDSLMLFGSIKNFCFYDSVKPGESMEHRVSLEKELQDSAVFSGETWSNDTKVASVERVIVAVRPK